MQGGEQNQQGPWEWSGERTTRRGRKKLKRWKRMKKIGKEKDESEREGEDNRARRKGEE